MNKFSPRRLLAVLVLALLLMAGCFAAENPEQQQDGEDQGKKSGEQGLISATVTNVVDGDTAQVTLTGGREERVRFIGVDTPESTRGKNDPYGKEASDYTKAKLEGQQIWLEFDIGERDRYDRMLAYIWLEQPASFNESEIQAKMFNAELLLEGYAQIMTVPPNVKYVDYFKTFQQEAREANKGLWSLVQESPGPFIASANSNKYHRPDCESGQKIAQQNLIEFKTMDEALNAGYEPCRVCNP